MRAALAAVRASGASESSESPGAAFTTATAGAAATSARSVTWRGALRGVQPHSTTRRVSVRGEMPIIAAMSGTGVSVNS